MAGPLDHEPSGDGRRHAEGVPRPAALCDRDALFAGLDRNETILLAVSGGPDSMALMLLAAEWASEGVLHVATVDHGLRPEARDEARFVASIAATLGLPHTILDWAGPKPSSRIQERARDARYALLVAHARAVGAASILTAHHADDQAETVLLRLGRGSGITGLAGMRRETPLAPGLALVRPLLDIAKTDLVAFCRHADQRFVDDPSNADPTYARVRLRAQAAALRALGLDAPSLNRLAARMARADAALEAESGRVVTRVTQNAEPGFVRVRLDVGAPLQPEILLRVLRRLIETIVPGRPLRLDRLETLTAGIQAAMEKGRPWRGTLGGARVVLDCDTTISIHPEAPRRRGAPREGRPAVIKAELTRPLGSLGKT